MQRSEEWAKSGGTGRERSCPSSSGSVTKTSARRDEAGEKGAPAWHDVRGESKRAVRICVGETACIVVVGAMVEPDLIAVFGKDPDGIALAVTAVLRLCEEELA